MPNKHTPHGLALIVGAAVSLFTTCALADGPYGAYGEPPPPPPPPLTWTGLYVGGNVGWAWATTTVFDNLNFGSASTDQNGLIGGAQIGYNYQLGSLVLGIEWDFDWSSIEGNGLFRPSIVNLRSSADTQWISTLAGRAGLTFDRTLVYVKVGGGWVQNEPGVTSLTTGATFRGSNSGWLIGAGTEYAFLPHWTAKIEWDFLDFADQTGFGIVRTDTFDISRNVQMLKFGINYKFN
jgi:outer membrane immunogenic protein